MRSPAPFLGRGLFYLHWLNPDQAEPGAYAARFLVSSRESFPTQGYLEVIDYPNTLLTGELAVRDQYLIHSRIYEDWGFSKLHERLNHEMKEETQHADAPLRRIPLLEGTPRMRSDDIHPGTTVPEMLEADPKLECHVHAALAKGIALYEQHKDFVSRDILKTQLVDIEEDHAYWSERQLGLITRMGPENYLQSQI